MSTPVSVHTPRRTRRFSWPRIGFTEAQAAWAGRGLLAAAPLLSFTLVEVLNYNNPWTDFTAAQLIGLAVLLGVLLLGSVAIICLTLTGKTGYILPALGGTLVTTFLVGMLVISEI